MKILLRILPDFLVKFWAILRELRTTDIINLLEHIVSQQNDVVTFGYDLQQQRQEFTGPEGFSRLDVALVVAQELVLTVAVDVSTEQLGSTVLMTEILQTTDRVNDQSLTIVLEITKASAGFQTA